jgi:hypothetical protein
MCALQGAAEQYRQSAEWEAAMMMSRIGIGTIKLAAIPLAVAVFAAATAGALALPTAGDANRAPQVTTDRDGSIVVAQKKKKKKPGKPAPERRGS